MQIIGKASGVMSALRYLGGVFGVAIAVLAFDTFGGLGSAVAFSNGFARAIGFCAGLSLMGAVTGLTLPARREFALKGANA
jgi:hypothetical protein